MPSSQARTNRSSLRRGMPANSPLRGSDSAGITAPSSLVAARESSSGICRRPPVGKGSLELEVLVVGKRLLERAAAVCYYTVLRVYIIDAVFSIRSI